MTAAENMPFKEAIEARRSYYNLTNQSTISDEKLAELVADAIKYTPSSFNSQTSRAVLVTGEKNKTLWKAIWEAFSANLPADQLPTYQGKFENVYSAGYGTVVFYEDQDAVDAFVSKTPMVGPVIDAWTANTNGMAQYIVWTALATHGMGGNLQHYGQYGPGNAEAINKTLEVPSGWKVPLALLTFGVPTGGPGNPAHPKTFEPLLGERVLVRN